MPCAQDFLSAFRLVGLALSALFSAGVLVAQPAPTQEEQGLAETDQLLVGQQWLPAAERARALADGATSPKTRLAALERLAVAQAGLGNVAESAQAAQEAEYLFVELEEARLATAKIYFRNRFELDGGRRHTIDLQRKCEAAAEAGGFSRQAVPAVVALACRFPEPPGRRELALDAGERLLALGRKDEAIPWFVAALDSGLDRSFMTKAKLADNQEQLDAVAKAPSPDLVARALAGLAGQPPPEGADAIATRFQAALEQTRLVDDRGAVAALAEMVAEPSPAPIPLADLARLELARTHLRGGRAVEAKSVLAGIRPEPAGLLRRVPAIGNALAANREFLLGLAANQLPDRKEAAERFAEAAALGGDALAELSLFEQARSLELVGDWPEAGKLYRHLATKSPAVAVRRWARIALARLDAYGDAGLLEGSAVVPLPEDRETHGDWYLGYGREFALICGNDRIESMGGKPGTVLKLAFSTSDPKERGRRWVSDRASPDPAALWNPYRRTRYAANQNDHGEQYPIGAGPDLLVKASVPEGQHILALCFANEYAYYEANRRYTIEVRSGGRVLALADVHDFGTGVYSRFLVVGPRELDLCIRRDASLNVILQGVFLDPIPALDAPPLPGGTAAPGPDLYGEYAARLQRSPAYLLAHPAPLLALAAALASEQSADPAYQRYQTSRLLLAAGRPRAANEAFAEFAATVPPNRILGLAHELGNRLGPTVRPASQQILDWPLGTHPLDVLSERWLASWLGEARPSPVRIGDLRDLLESGRPEATPYVRGRALPVLKQYAPGQLTPDLLERVAGQFKSEGDASQAGALYQQALAANPPPRIELRVCFDLLNIAGRAGLSLPEIRALYARTLKLAEEAKADHMIAAIHLQGAQALADHGQFDEAIRLLDHAPPAMAANLKKFYEQQRDSKQKTKAP